jgi:methylenetetrahydrofolate reductase (NADPH)
MAARSRGAVSAAGRRLAPLERVNRQGLAVAASFEFFPPRTPELLERLEDTAARLRPLNPAFVSVTYGAGGSTRERTHETVLRLAKRGFAVAAHLTCVAHSPHDLLAIAHRYRLGGISHVVALRGDLPSGDDPLPERRLEYASQLVALLRDAGIPEVSVACFPEGHPDSRFDIGAEIENLKRKQAAGATRAITQFVLDNATYLRFVERAQRAGVSIPIVPGILPITNVEQTRSFAQKVGATVPRWLDAVFDGLDEDPQTRELVAASVAAEQCADLATHGVEHVHFYTLNRASLTLAVCRLIGIGRPAAAAVTG